MFEIDPELKEILGDAQTTAEKASACVSWGEAQVSEHHRNSKELKGELIAKFVIFQRQLQRAGLLLPITKAMERGLKNRSGNGDLRKHFKRMFLNIAFQRCGITRRSTASRWARVAQALEREGVEPENFGKEIARRGMKKILGPPRKRVQRPNPPHGDSTDADKIGAVGDEHGDTETQGPSRHAPDNPNGISTDSQRLPADCRVSGGSPAFVLTVSADVLRGFGGLTDGHHTITIELHKTGTRGEIAFATLDNSAYHPLRLKTYARIPVRGFGRISPEAREQFSKEFLKQTGWSPESARRSGRRTP